MVKVRNLFISHSWSYSNAYDCLCRLLEGANRFEWKNYSVPKDDPIHTAGSDVLLREAIRNQMKPASVVLIMAGVYATHSKWINIEISLAKELGKPIIAVEPWGSERTSVAVKNAASRIVSWNTSSVVNAIRELS